MLKVIVRHYKVQTNHKHTFPLFKLSCYKLGLLLKTGEALDKRLKKYNTSIHKNIFQ